MYINWLNSLYTYLMQCARSDLIPIDRKTFWISMFLNICIWRTHVFLFEIMYYTHAMRCKFKVKKLQNSSCVHLLAAECLYVPLGFGKSQCLNHLHINWWWKGECSFACSVQIFRTYKQKSCTYMWLALSLHLISLNSPDTIHEEMLLSWTKHFFSSSLRYTINKHLKLFILLWRMPTYIWITYIHISVHYIEIYYV